MQKEIRNVQIKSHSQGHSGMTTKGFTLIELLVVVLIIGILAAIALPQYQKAVEKSRLTEALHTAKLVEECFDWYLLEHSLPSSGLVELKDMNCPIEINLGEWNEGEGRYMSADFDNYNPGCSRISCYEEIYRLPDYKYGFNFTVTPSQRSHYCYTFGTDTGRYICNSLRSQGWEYVDGDF